MALIVCPECRKQVSDAAPTCPQCGFPISQGGAPPTAVPGVAPPQSQTGEQTLWEGRGSLRAALPAFVKWGLGSGLIVALFHVGLARLPEWACKVSDKVCEYVDTSHFDTVWTYAFYFELAILALLALQLVRAILVLKSIYIRVTNQRLVSEWGIISKQADEVDLRLVKDTAFSQGLFERLLGYGTVLVISSDPTHPRLNLRAIRKPRELRELVRSHAYKLTEKQGFVRMA